MEIEPWRPSLVPSKSRYNDGGVVGRSATSSNRDRRADNASITVVFETEANLPLTVVP